MFDTAGRPPDPMLAQSAPQVRMLGIERRLAYAFACRWNAYRSPSQLLIDTAGNVILAVGYRTSHAHISELGVTFADPATLALQMGEATQHARFATSEEAAYVRNVLWWLASPGSAQVLGGGHYDYVLYGCIYLGGSGMPLQTESNYDIVFRHDRIDIFRSPVSFVFSPEATLALATIQNLALGGPGRTKTGGGFIGGGFGVNGAAAGMVAAAVLNKLTTRIKIWSTITVISNEAEAFFAHTAGTPNQLRMQLSPAFLRLDEVRRHARGVSIDGKTRTEQRALASSPTISDEFERLAALRASGVITDEEFSIAKQVLLRGENAARAT